MKDWLNIMRKLNENKNGKVITFDFDNTIVKSFENNSDGMHINYQFGGLNKQIIARIKKFKESGATVMVVTSRNVHQETPEDSVDTMLKKLNLKVDGIFYTNGNPKAQKLYELGSTLHYDDDPKEHEAIKEYSKLHHNFGITVKYPDDLLSDIDEVSKGLILTRDNQFVIVQRSDSQEWDAPGGHLLDGEEPAYAFFREIEEEMRLTVDQVEYLDFRDTKWKEKQLKVYYFIARVPYTTDELEGAIELQWELNDYFTGDLTQIQDQMASADGATENLKNVVNLVMGDDFLLKEGEKSHAEMSYRLLGTGGSKSTGADGLKKMKNFKKGKSAPPGAPGGGSIGTPGAALEEEAVIQKKKKIKIRIKSGINEKKTGNDKYHWNVKSWEYGGGYGGNRKKRNKK